MLIKEEFKKVMIGKNILALDMLKRVFKSGIYSLSSS